jgi:hypothetical protein
MSIQDEKVPVRVKFVKPKYKDGSTEVLALFLHQTSYYSRDRRMITCYAHIGQHSSADESFLRRRLATREEYLPLLKELESLGYVVTVVNKEKEVK